MKFLKFKNLFLPLALVGVLATGMPFLGGAAVWSLGRWVVLALLAAYLIVAHGSVGQSSLSVVTVWVTYIIWCGLSAGWSAAPVFSSIKAIGVALAVFAAIPGGQQWVRTHRPSEALDFLLPWAALSLLAGLPGSGASAGFYSGSVGGANFLGAAVAMSLPVIVFRLSQDRGSRLRMLVGAAALVAALMVIYLSNSRASYLVTLGVAGGFLATLKMGRRSAVLAGVVWGAIILSVLAPGAAGAFYQRNIVKQEAGRETQTVTSSRDGVWEESQAAAARGGWFGLGFGLSAGSDAKLLTSTFTTSPTLEYGREKGNSQLAILEELGIVGFVLYVTVQAVLFVSLVGGIRRTTGDARVALIVIIGAMLGMFAHSFLEGWWTSPGSTEFGYFCAMAGAGLGLVGSRRQSSSEEQRLKVRLARARAGRFVASL